MRSRVLLVELECPPKVEEASSLPWLEREEMTELMLVIKVRCSAKAWFVAFWVAIIPPKTELSCWRSVADRELAPPDVAPVVGTPPEPGVEWLIEWVGCTRIWFNICGRLVSRWFILAFLKLLRSSCLSISLRPRQKRLASRRSLIKFCWTNPRLRQSTTGKTMTRIPTQSTGFLYVKIV